ncbi:argonaute [Rhodotorula toruloides]|uniref:Argonaute n=1 Tax=Rhodotorula toruloides TaxID=5286 RepID=A0A511KBV6_RHOTO|nr:argonaute [Rhodotorula toruloides]
MEALTAEFKSLAVTSLGDPGQTGVGPSPSSPLYRLKFKKPPSIAHYDVTLTEVRAEDAPPRRPGMGPPPAINRETSIAIWDALVVMNPDNLGEPLRQAAFDCRKNAFTLGRLNIPDGTKTYRVVLPAESETRAPRQFDVKLSLAQFLDLSILDAFCQHKRAANLSDLAARAIMALDVLLRHGMYRKQDYVVGGAGRKFLNKRASTPLGQGGELLAGLFQSVRPTVSGMVVNLDSAFSPFIVAGDLLSVCNAIVGRQQTQGGPPQRGGRGGRGGPRGRGGYPAAGRAMPASFSDQELRELKRKLGNAKVRVTHRKDTRPFTIVGFGQPVGRQVVSIGDRSKKGKGKGAAKPTAKEAAAAAAKGQPLPVREKEPQQTMTVAEYFAKTYNKTNINLALPAVELRGGQFVPMEVLELLHGHIIPPTQLTAQQASAMINTAAKPPAQRRADIDQIRKQAEFGPGSHPNAWGLNVSVDMMRLQGRLLPPPKVQYHATSRKAMPNVAFGSWNLVESKFLVPAPPLVHWSVAVFAPEQFAQRPALQNFFGALIQQAAARTYQIRVPPDNVLKVTYWDGREDRLTTLERAAKLVMQNNPQNKARQPPQLIFCILQDPKAYDDIKRKSALELPVPVTTQCCLLKNIFKPRGIDQYCANLLLKINAKLGGINSTVDQRDLPGLVPGKTLLLGADVTHPTGAGTARAGGDVPSSIAAVVAAVDSSNMKYAAQVREQEGRKEMISELASMSETLIRSYMKNTKGRPDSIIMFRDGISEGQLAPCVHAELSQIKAACRKIDPNWSPKLTYVICAKRHHVRFWAQNEKDCDRTGNIPPGVVVDSEIVHPYIFEFYLQAHAGLKGTAKPTRYICLLDENGFTSDKLQKLVNSLCYSFARATRSVSLVPVAYYADIVAGKARAFVDTDDASTERLAPEAQKRDSRYIQDKLDRSLFSQSMWFM